MLSGARLVLKKLGMDVIDACVRSQVNLVPGGKRLTNDAGEVLRKVRDRGIVSFVKPLFQDLEAGAKYASLLIKPVIRSVFARSICDMRYVLLGAPQNGPQ